MWGYDRSADSELVPFKTQDEHFELFCMVLERGFAIHTCQSDRLVVEFKLTDTGSRRYLPRVKPKSGVSFRIPEDWLKPSDLYLHYDPSSDTDIPELAYFKPDQNIFVPYDYENEDLFEADSNNPHIPVVKLSTLKGLHYIKDIACLQMFELDFDKLFKADPALADQVKDVLARKMSRFVEFSHPWVQANHAERVAQQYLDNYSTRNGSTKAAAKPAKSQPGDNSEGPFMGWD